MSEGNTFEMGKQDTVCAETETQKPDTPFMVEKAEMDILVYSTKEGPLRLTHREALALAAILTDLAQSK